jgi:alpha-galactosidase
VESAALQFASILYSVPQISVKLATLCEEHRKMLAFYLSFWRKNRDILLNGRLLAANPESAYSLVCAEKDGVAIFTAYTDTLIDCAAYTRITAVNATRSGSLLLKGADGKTYRVLDCMGNTLEEGILRGALCEVKVPLSGMAEVL